MTSIKPLTARTLDENAALRMILEGTATETGQPFFEALVLNLARALQTTAAIVTEYIEEIHTLRSLAFWVGGEWIRDYQYDVLGTPCEPVVKYGCFFHHPENIQELFPQDISLREMGLVSYMGVPILDLEGHVLGTLAVLDMCPMPEEPTGLAVFRIFAARATAEIRRIRAEADVREREAQLSRLVHGAMDAIIQVDKDLRLLLLNPAAEKIFGCVAGQAAGWDFSRFLTGEDPGKLARLMDELDASPPDRQCLWIPGGLQARRFNGETFPAEATLSRHEIHRHAVYTLILRNVNERLKAEKKIQSLTRVAEYLKEEIKELHNFDEIVGHSESLLQVLRDVRQVACTDATVLILGETGTGKELFARAIHNASRRKDKPLIRVNCAAIPASLIESEFFGHEQGAFTGATQKRDGRFTLTDGGTIFLDEIGELPLDLQGKLLRVLQEGEFEPVGSSKTRKVDVRILAATNRDLQHDVKQGKFREDLYYRLNVFPLHVPPLRERGDDVILLAEAFARRFAQRMGRAVEPLSPICVRRLKAYDWPGNVRELENVIERALIISHDGRLNLDRALPDSRPGADSPIAVPFTSDTGDPSPRIHTLQELQEMERSNILRALDRCAWRVSGGNGAARLLGMNPSTLSSRMKALGIKKPVGT